MKAKEIPSLDPLSLCNLTRCVALIVFLAMLGLSTVTAQTLTNGASHDGTVLLNQTNTWTFTANAGDNIILRAARLTTTNTFNPWVRIYNPIGVLIADSGSSSTAVASESALTTTNSGAFTVLVSDTSFSGSIGTGQYRLYFAKFPGAFADPDDGGTFTNGGFSDGTIDLADLDFWTFTANAGDQIVLRSTRLSGNLQPYLRFYNSNGVLITNSTAGSSTITFELSLTMTNSGTFTVLVSDGSFNGVDDTGTYRIYFAKFPGAFGDLDDGGTFTNGGFSDGTIDLADLDFWTFTANAGDQIVLRSTRLSGSIQPYLRFYNSNGVLITNSTAGSSTITFELSLTMTNSGTFTVLVSDGSFNGVDDTGTYRIYFAKFPGAFFDPDDGGALTNGLASEGTILLGDLDFWQFMACRGDSITLKVDELTDANAFDPLIRLYGPSGILVASQSGLSTALINITVTNSGKFTLLISDGSSGGIAGSGGYRITGTGISGEGLRLCMPIIMGTNVDLAGMGGMPGTNFVLFTHTNVATPRGLWTPIWTNQFDPFGAFSRTNLFNPAEQERYFLLRQE